MALIKHGNQYHEYKDIKDTFLDCYKPKSKSASLTVFETTEEEVRKFINYFIENGIKNESLRDKLYQNFNDGNFILDTKPGGENSHLFNMIENELVVETYKRAKLGNKLPSGKYVSDIKTIRGIIHELAHSTSQKFDETYLNSSDAKQKIANNSLEKDSSIGEIESKFIEKVFNDFILNNADKIEESGCSLSGIQDLKEEIRDLDNYDVCDFLERLTHGMHKDNIDYKNSIDHRYIVGTIISNLMFEDYKNNPKEILEQFNKYLENQCSMDIDEASSFLMRGKCHNYGQAINQYKQILQINNNHNQSL